MAASKKGKIKKDKVSKFSRKSKLRIYGKRQAGIGSSSKGHAFAEFRKLKVMRQYKKFKRHQQKQVEEGDMSETGESNWQRGSAQFTRMKNKYQTAQAEYGNRKSEEERQRKEAEEKQRMREQELEEKQRKRRETHRKLKRKTKYGQPIMSNHMECLLEKIQRR